MYWRRPPARPPRPAPAPPARPSPVTSLLADQFHDKPWGGDSHGEILSHAPRQPAPPPAPPLQIEPPPWADELASGDLEVSSLIAPPEPQEQLSALDQMKLTAGDIDWPEAPGPPMVTPPLTRPVLPEVDWRQEEQETAARDAHVALVEEISQAETTQPGYPKRKGKP